MADTTIELGSLLPGSDGSYEVDGRRVAMPVEVRRARMANATFLVPADAAQSVIAQTGLRVDRRRGGKAVVALALIDYLDNDLGDYDEFALSFVVQNPPGTPALGRGAVATYIHRLPVSQPFTCEAGRGIWGFPKWVAGLRVDVGDGEATAVLRNDDGGELLSIRLRRGIIPAPSRPLTMACYSNGPDGRILRTSWITRTASPRLRFGGGGAEVLVGEGHPLADELRALGFPRKCLMTMFAASMSATFEAPVPL
jgi:hypothetical protein